MPLPPVFDRHRGEIEEELLALLEPYPGLPYNMLRYHLGWQDPEGRPANSGSGKLLRPALCLFACEALGGDWCSAVPAAAGVEFIHNFSLIHDDIQDQDVERRHRSTVWFLWGRGHALNAGDCMAILGHRSLLRMAERGISGEKVEKASTLLAHACLEMIEGQTLDLSYEGRLGVTVEDYLHMVSKKTSALMACSLAIGALLGAREEQVVEVFWRGGLLLGLAFQIKDDLLGIWGVEEVTGKPSGSDIKRRKKSLPVVYGLLQAPQEARKELLRRYNTGEMDDEGVAWTLHLLESLGVRGQCEQLLAHYCEQARQELASLSLQPRAWEDVEQVTSFLIDRTY